VVQREIDIEAPQGLVYDIICDFESYPEFLQSMVKVKKRGKDRVEFKLHLIKDIHYSLCFSFDPPKALRWELVKGDLMKKNSGSWELTAISNQQTKALYSIDLKFNWLVPKMIVDQLTKIQLPETLEAFKMRAEALLSNTLEH